MSLHSKLDNQVGNKSKWITPATVAGFYLAMGGLWILFSDQALDYLVRDPLLLTKAQTLKGWFYVLVTSALLYLVLRGHYRAVRSHVADMETQRTVLVQKELFLETLLNAIPTPVFYMDRSGRYLGTNRAFREFFGTRDGQGEHEPELQFVSPELAEHSRAKNDALFESGQAQQYESRVWDARGDSRDVVFHKAVFKDGSGSVGGLIGTIIDITESKLTEKALRRSEESFRELINSISDLIYTQDLDGRFLTLNRSTAQIFGYKQEEMVGKKASEFMRPEFREAFRSEYLEGIKRDGKYEGVSLYFSKSGKPKYLEYRSTLVTTETGERYISGSGRDITERMKAIREREALKDQLRQAQKMEAVGTLAGGIAHDFNNILAAITGYAELGLTAPEGDAGAARELEEILKSAERAKNLVRQILTFSRKLAFDPKPLNVNTVVDDTAEIISRTIPKMISLKVVLGRELRLINGDLNQIQQILLNLASNAKDSMPDGGRLVIETENVTLDEKYAGSHLNASPGDYVLISVTDTGHGMDKQIQEHIFEPFFTTKDTGKGTGLGLASAYGIVKGHGGSIVCYSEPGAGTTFKIYLPALAEGDESVASEQAEGGAIPGGRESVLLVDDEEGLLQIGSQILGGKGYRVITAVSGEEAVTRFRENTDGVDLVILDLIMPGMGGGKALKEILAVDPKAKVIIASGYSANGQARAALESGARGYMAKPYPARELLATVRKVLDEPE